jgi:hypothetical protein
MVGRSAQEIDGGSWREGWFERQGVLDCSAMLFIAPALLQVM